MIRFLLRNPIPFFAREQCSRTPFPPTLCSTKPHLSPPLLPKIPNLRLLPRNIDDGLVLASHPHSLFFRVLRRGPRFEEGPSRLGAREADAEPGVDAGADVVQRREDLGPEAAVPVVAVDLVLGALPEAVDQELDVAGVGVGPDVVGVVGRRGLEGDEG